MRRLVLLGGMLLATAVPTGAARAADECAGLMVCIPVAGPWVVVAATSSPALVRWELRCPQGAVGGTDARISERAIEVTFPGRVGSPVGPGVTTTDVVLFSGRYVGPARARSVSFRPYIGCIPASGGGRRIPTSAPTPAPAPVASAAALRTGTPVIVRTRTIPVEAGQLARGSLRCRSGERLLRATTAVALSTSAAPSAAQGRAITVVRAVRSGRVLVSARRGALAPSIAAQVQIQAECAR